MIGKPCFNRQIGVCPGVCTGEISKRKYGKQIQNIKLLFSGKKGKLIRTLEREMKRLARTRKFEKAAKIRNEIFSLKHIQDISLLKDTCPERVSQGARRVEGYDVAHLSGGGMVGVMVVVLDGEPNKNEYRKFILKTISRPNDPGALKEVFERRLKHREWRAPNLIVVDGNKTQIRVVEKLLQAAQSERRLGRGQTLGGVIPVVGVVKNEYHRPKRIEGERNIVRRYEREIVLANAEAHRFAVKFHRQRIRKGFI